MAFPTSASGMELAVRVTLTRLYDTDSSAGNAPCPARSSGQPDLSLFNGQVRWVGPPQSLPEGSGPDPNRFAGAALQDCPSFTDWPAAMAALGQGVLHVYGAEIVPCSQYEVELVEFGCAETFNEEACFSTPLTVRTGKWGDVTAPFYPSSGQPNFTDINAVLAKFNGLLPPFKVETMLRGNVPPVTRAINFTDIGRAVDAFKSIPYPEVGPDAESPIDGLVSVLSDMEQDLTAQLTGSEYDARFQAGVPTVFRSGSQIGAQSTIELFQNGNAIASGQSTLTMDLCAATGDVTMSLTEGTLTRTLTQNVSLNGDVVTLFGTLSFSDGSPTLNGGWTYSLIVGAAEHVGSDPGFHDEAATMLHIIAGTANVVQAGHRAGAALTFIGNVISLGINYIINWFIPYTPPVSCDGPTFRDGPGESCENANLPCRQDTPSMCENIDGIPDVSRGLRKCMKGRCGCGGSSHPRLQVSCADSNTCGPCGLGAGCNIGGAEIWYCSETPNTCDCINIVSHEMSHACGVIHSLEYFQDPSCDIPGEEACRIGDWFEDQCMGKPK